MPLIYVCVEVTCCIHHYNLRVKNNIRIFSQLPLQNIRIQKSLFVWALFYTMKLRMYANTNMLSAFAYWVDTYQTCTYCQANHYDSKGGEWEGSNNRSCTQNTCSRCMCYFNESPLLYKFATLMVLIINFI